MTDRKAQLITLRAFLMLGDTAAIATFTAIVSVWPGPRGPSSNRPSVRLRLDNFRAIVRVGREPANFEDPVRSLLEMGLNRLRWLAKTVRHEPVRSLQALSGRVIVLLVLKHLIPERDHFGIEPSSFCRHLKPQ